MKKENREKKSSSEEIRQPDKSAQGFNCLVIVMPVIRVYNYKLKLNLEVESILKPHMGELAYFCSN